ncbi:ADP-ribosylglycohydrolase family protein [Marinobacter sp.]|uniref:ADP-ribosylglycohydrolase family protein n=1 Tax=Marinobacter sp. TaxID=50741 RepID=UPI0029C9BE17|nr:ADP-ribosylglycohydrolase family protein [Marinobacter sp.]
MKDQYAAFLLGGAIGDALGAAVEFMPRAETLSRFGPEGITDYAPAYGTSHGEKLLSSLALWPLWRI